MKTQKYIEKVMGYRTKLVIAQECAFERLFALTKGRGKIKLKKPLRLEGFLYPITHVWYGKMEVWVIVNDNTGGIVPRSIVINARGRINNPLSAWLLVREVEKGIGITID